MKKVVLATDIFGITDHVLWLADQFSNVCQIAVVDPYEGREMNFSDEKAAYKYYTEHVGLDRYKDMVESKVLKTGSGVLLGFSAGASAAWRVVAKAKGLQAAIGVYSSQIRNYLDLNPRCRCDLVFPAKEAGFDLEPVVERLAAKPMVSVARTTFLHGFMNKHSTNYDQAACARYVEEIKKMIISPA